jgi:hypothetical protein
MGAQPFGTVTLAQNGYPPVTMGSTDSNGDWSISAVETSYHVGSYNQTWAVNGIAMTPLNPNATYLPWAPKLPVFTVYSNFTGSNCPQASTEAEGCYYPLSTARRWGWSPVVVKKDQYSTVSASAISTAVGQWNGIQSRVQYSYSPLSVRIDVLIVDGYAYGDNARTFTFGQDCTGCVGYTNTCTGACTTIDKVSASDIYLDMGVIATAASYLGISSSAAVEYTLRHEMGHSLRVNHSYNFDARCSEVQSLMYPSLSVLVGCGVVAPKACDGATINTIYPTGAPTCPTSSLPTCVVPGGAC